MPQRHDVVIVGSGPNGLAAGCFLARAGLRTLVLEAHSHPGGGTRSQALTLPGFLHDVCSTVHPLAVASPAFRELELDRYGLGWIESPAPLAHVFDDATVVTLERSLEATSAQLGVDAEAYEQLMRPFSDDFSSLARDILGPLNFPSNPWLFARFGWTALRSMTGLAQRFRDPRTSALLAGMAAHAMLPLDAAATASFSLVLAIAGHAVGWPLARGGSHAICEALVSCLKAAGGELQVDREVRSRKDLPEARAYVFDVTPKQLLRILGNHLPARYAAKLSRFRYGPGVFKLDWALRAPVPWRNPACARAATVHIGGPLERMAEAAAAANSGSRPERPFVLFVQPSLFDSSRAPAGYHTAWAYCHVPHNDTVDMSDAIESEIERAAPGFRDIILARCQRNSMDMERYNANYVGGDINGGLANLGQLFFRPTAQLDPYRTALSNVFLCSSSTPPGGGVHGMCGYWAARSVLHNVFKHTSRTANRNFAK